MSTPVVRLVLPAIAATVAMVLSLGQLGTAEAKAPKALDVRGPVTCQGNQQVVLRHVRIDVASIAVNASGNCAVTIESSVIISRRGTAIEGHDNSAISIKDTTIYGKKNAVHIVDSGAFSIAASEVASASTALRVSRTAAVNVAGTTFRGRKRISKAAAVHFGRGNRWLKSQRAAPPTTKAPNARPQATREPSAESKRKAHAPVFCDRRQRIRLASVSIDTAKIAVRASGRCVVEIRDATIRSTAGDAIVVDGAARVVIVGSTITAKKRGIATSGGAQVTLDRSDVGGVRSALMAEGASAISAADSRIRGRRSIGRASTFTDRGKNQFLSRPKR